MTNRNEIFDEDIQKVKEDLGIVKNNSEGNRYNYASLSDIANQGYKIPKMKTATEMGKEYVYWYDEELKEWLRGAMVVVPSPIVNAQGKASMNEAQLYGSALTYARRYTTLMALQLACEDDKELESKPPVATEKQLTYLKNLCTEAQLNMFLTKYNLETLEDMPGKLCNDLIKWALNKNEVNYSN